MINDESGLDRWDFENQFQIQIHDDEKTKTTKFSI
jgi:hypothetical protein